MKLLLFILFIPNIIFAQNDTNTVTLYYANNQFKPSVSHFKTIDSIKSIYKPDEIRIQLKGFANEIGTHEFNLNLSQKRVDFIANAFSTYEITSTLAKGEINGDLTLNRRVEIEISINPSPIIEVTEVHQIESIPIIEQKIEENINNFTDLKIGKKLALNNIFFTPGSDYITTESEPSLNELYKFLEENSKTKIQILGHVCCPQYKNPSIDGVNSRTGKRNLSEARAKRVYFYLIEKGIEKSRLKYKGLASKYPLGKGDDYDRRVEIEIIN
jgi:outer membrane protein OmpA-like peptidoglycan-associated protein